MTTATILDLDALPAPVVVQELAFETIFVSKLRRLIAIDAKFSALVESDPAIKLLEAASYDEMLLRQRINTAARARLLAFAAGSDLDQLAAFYGVTRLAGELDQSLKTRVRAAIMSRSAAGTADQYRFAGLSASTEVADIAVDSPAGGQVRVSVLSTLGDGTPSDALLATVRAVVTSTSVRALGPSITVVPAEIILFDVVGDVYLTPTAPASTFDALETLLRTKFAAVRGLGFNVAPSWVTAAIQVGGVQRLALTSPAAQIVIAPNQCATLRTVDLEMAGRDY